MKDASGSVIGQWAARPSKTVPMYFDRNREKFSRKEQSSTFLLD